MEAGTEIRKHRAMEFHIDLKYEFCAPHFYDFCAEETVEEAAAAERWFAGALAHPASPLVGKLKTVEELSKGCSLEEYIEVQKLVARVTPELSKTMEANISSTTKKDGATGAAGSTNFIEKRIDERFKEIGGIADTSNEASKEEPCTPKEQFPQRFAELQSIKAPANSGRVVPSRWKQPELHKRGTSKNIQTSNASGQLTAVKRRLSGPQKIGLDNQTHITKKQKLEGCQVLNAKIPQAATTLTISQQFRLNAEKHESKRQKLEGGGFDQVTHSKPPRTAPSLTVPHEFHFHTEKRAHAHGQCIIEAQSQSSSMPYIPVAEMVQRFQMNILGDFKTQDKTGISRKRNLKLTHPKEPTLGTSLRARPPSVKSFAEQEEEMLANLPKFRARPLNKRILQGPTLLPPPRSTPQLPEFQEFNLKTMERALIHHNNHHAVTPMTASIAINNREQSSLAKGELDFERPSRRIKTTRELEQVLAMMPKFKARPLDKRIFSSRGEVGVYTVPKRQATVPKEFQFATDQRALQHDATVVEQRSQEERFLQYYRHGRPIFLKELSTHSASICTSDWTPNTLKDFNENQNLQENIKAHESGTQQMLGEACIGTVHPERIRKPLGEIQQQFVFGQAVQQTRIQKIDNDPFPLSHMGLQQSQPTEEFPVQTRSMKEVTQHWTPRRMLDAQAPKTPFPMYLMR